jgi:hypothetical protein
MLAPSQVQRFVRQILVPEVGRGGQQRWLEARLEARGAGPALEAALELVAAAGVTVERSVLVSGAPARIGTLRLGETAFADERSACQECLMAFFAAQPASGIQERAAVAFAAGAAAAAEALVRLLDPERQPIAMVFTPEPRRARVGRPGCTCQT